MPKVVIAAGGTAGHVVPALAVADALRDSGAEVEFVGGERAEAELVPAAGFPVPPAAASRASTARNPLRAARAVAACRCAPPAGRARMLRAHGRRRRDRRRRLRGRAGRAGGPARCGCRWCSPRPTATWGSPTGCSRRSPGASSSPSRSRAATGRSYEVVGRPLPAGTGSADRAAARARFGVGRGRPCLLVFGGSLGARRLNEAALDGVRRRRARARCCTPAAGATTTSSRRGWRRSARRRTTACTPTSSRSPTRWPPPTWWSRAPGGSVLRWRPPGLPSVLVPYPHATADHQTANARHMEARRRRGRGARRRARRPAAGARGGCAARVRPSRCAPWRGRPQSVARPDAAERIAAEVLRAIEG